MFRFSACLIRPPAIPGRLVSQLRFFFFVVPARKIFLFVCGSFQTSASLPLGVGGFWSISFSKGKSFGRGFIVPSRSCCCCCLAVIKVSTFEPQIGFACGAQAHLYTLLAFRRHRRATPFEVCVPFVLSIASKYHHSSFSID